MPIFFDLTRVSLFRSKKHSLLSRISKNVSFWLFLLKKKKWGKGRFFDKNHGLTPFGKCPFFRSSKNFTFQVLKAFFSIQNIKKCFFLAFFGQKKNMRKRLIFWQKPWTNPFAKCRFFSTLRELYFWGPKNLYFLSRILKNSFFWLFLLKKNI